MQPARTRGTAIRLRGGAAALDAGRWTPDEVQWGGLRGDWQAGGIITKGSRGLCTAVKWNGERPIWQAVRYAGLSFQILMSLTDTVLPQTRLSG